MEDKARGALLGLAVGDALGCTSEFMVPGEFMEFSDMDGGGVFSLKPGMWSDDTSLTLCLADSLLEKRVFDPRDQLDRYVRWLREGYRSSTGRAFDIGGITRQALTRYLATDMEYPGLVGEFEAGNGSIMRLAPVPLYFHNSSTNELLSYCALSSRTTHAEPVCEEACQFMGLWIRDAIKQKGFLGLGEARLYIEAIEQFNGRRMQSDLREVLKGERREESRMIISSGYVVHTMDVALWALESTSSFEEGLVKVVNLGGDADTAGAVFGQLAGSLYGVDAIPTRWKNKVHLREEIEALASQLIAER